jgi:hypothetical protein
MYCREWDFIYKKEDKFWGVDLRQVRRQDFGRGMHTLGHGTAQSQISFLTLVVCLPVPWRLFRRMSNEDFTLLWPVSTREQVWPKEAVFKTERGCDVWINHHTIT